MGQICLMKTKKEKKMIDKKAEKWAEINGLIKTNH